MGEAEENCLILMRRIKQEKQESEDGEKKKKTNTKTIKIIKNVVRDGSSAKSSDEEVHSNKAKRFRISNNRVISGDSDSICGRYKETHCSNRKTMEGERREVKREQLAEPEEKLKVFKKKREKEIEDTSSESSSEEYSSLSDEAGSRKKREVTDVIWLAYMLKTTTSRKKREDIESECSTLNDSSISDKALQRTKRKVARKTGKGRKNKDDNESGSSLKDSSPSDKEVLPRKNYPVKKKKEKVKKVGTKCDISIQSSDEEVAAHEIRPVVKKRNKKRVETRDAESEKSSPEDSSSSDEEVPRKKHAFTKREKTGKQGKKKREYESSSSNESSSDEEIPGKKRTATPRKRHEKEETSCKKSKVTKTQSKEGRQKADTNGSQKHTEKCQRRKYAIQRNCLQKPIDDTLTESNVKALSVKMKSVGALVSSGNLVGTVFSVGDRYIITAYHVIKRIPGHYLYQNKKTFANFNESPLTPPDVVFTFEKLTFCDELLDFAILEVSNPGSLPKGLRLSKLNCAVLGVSRISIIGYGHPDQTKKTLDPGCALIQPDSPRIELARKWMESNISTHKGILEGNGHNPRIADFGFGDLDYSSKFIIDSYIEKGASGAPALATCFDNGLLNVTGLVTQGIPEFFYLLPKSDTLDSFPRKHRFASGTTMNAIYDCIRKADLKLANALFN